MKGFEDQIKEFGFILEGTPIDFHNPVRYILLLGPFYG